MARMDVEGDGGFKGVFARHSGPGPTRHLYIVNCGPAVGVSWEAMVGVFSTFGAVESLVPAGAAENRAFVSFETEAGAAAAREALRERPVAELRGRAVNMEFAQRKQKSEEKASACQIDGPLAQGTSHSPINGLTVIPDFVTLQQEQELLAAVDRAPWQQLAKRRVQHYGYEFQYKIRTVDASQLLGPLPDFLSQTLGLLSQLPQLTTEASEPSLPFDQITVNEYPRGVGLSPHIDTHSAFEGAIVSLSLAGPCVFELRPPSPVAGEAVPWPIQRQRKGEEAEADSQNETPVPVFLPRRSLLIMSGEARYAWSHYIPHRKVTQEPTLPVRENLLRGSSSHDLNLDSVLVRQGDVVNGVRVPREERRVSITFRRVRRGPCACSFPEHCDSRQGLRLPGHGQRKPEAARETVTTASGALAAPKCTMSSSPSCPLQGHVTGKLGNAGEPAPLSPSGGPRPLEDATGRQNLYQPRSQCPPPCCPPPPPPENEDPSADVAGQLAGTGLVDPPPPALHAVVSPAAMSADAGRCHLATPEIERRHVHAMYDAIAPHFDATRFARWPKVSGFLGSLEAGSLVLDAGCGNGKYLGLNPACTFVGCDISPALVAICRSRGADVAAADTLLLPFREGAFDATISIAVLHHLSSRARRKRAIQELLRVVRARGRVLLTVWAAEQEDQSLIAKWTPLAPRPPAGPPPPPPPPEARPQSPRYTEEWVGDSEPTSPLVRALSRRESKSDRSQSLPPISESNAPSGGGGRGGG